MLDEYTGQNQDSLNHSPLTTNDNIASTKSIDTEDEVYKEREQLLENMPNKTIAQEIELKFLKDPKTRLMAKKLTELCINDNYF